jgi:signal transduction histidine kinase
MTLAEVFKFPKAKEKAFQNFFYKQDLIVCRTATVLVITIMLVLGVIDYYRILDISLVLLSRMIVCLVLVVLLAITFQKKINANHLQVYLMVINVTMVASFFFMDAMTKMPGFYVPNSLVIYFFVSSTVSGMRFRYSSLLNFFVIVTFILYFPSSYNWAFHKSQVPNIIIGFIVSLLISFMWEWYKRTNFLQQTQLNNLINIFSHDMASPLNSLVGLMGLRDENLVSKEEFALHQENVKKSIQNNILLLQNLVKWSKSQMDGFKPKLEPIDLQAIVKDAMTLLQNTAGEKTLRFRRRGWRGNCSPAGKGSTGGTSPATGAATGR